MDVAEVREIFPNTTCDVLALAANDRCDAQLEVFGRFDWPLLLHRNAILLLSDALRLRNRTVS